MSASARNDRWGQENPDRSNLGTDGENDAMRLRIGLAAQLLGTSLAISAAVLPAAAAAPEKLCLKTHTATLKDLTIACYSDTGCNYVTTLGGDPVRDYDVASVPFALGREKIEGIVTSSDAIMKKIAGYGYTCKPVKP